MGGWVLAALTNDGAVRAVARGAMPWVLLCQVFKALAYPMNGSLMGALDWFFSALILWAAGGAGVGTYVALSALGFGAGSGKAALGMLWAGLIGFFATQLLLGLSRIASGRGPW